MKKLLRPFITFAVLAASYEQRVQAQPSNAPPSVSIVWPSMDCTFNYTTSGGGYLRVKADATDSDGSITQVQFFSDTNLIGVATNAPYSVIWGVLGPAGYRILKAVAVDNLGASTESSPVQFIVRQVPQAPVFAINSPADGSMFSSPASFVFSAEVLANAGPDLSSLDFFVGANSVGTVPLSGPFTATTPPYSLTVSNVPEGTYRLRAKQYGYDVRCFVPGLCAGPLIHVVKLGIRPPRLKPDSRFEFDVVTSFPTNQNVIEASSNLLNWTPISTNVPFTNTFTFTDSSPATNAPRFYRTVAPSQ